MDTGCAISEITFIGVMTTIGSVNPLSQPTKPLFLIPLYQMISETSTAQVSVQLRSAVDERRKPVMPIRLPRMLLRKIVPMNGAQCRLCSPIDSATMS